MLDKSSYNQKDEQGRKQDYWFEEDELHNQFEGPYKDDKRHGQWVEQWRTKGIVLEGRYDKGEREGEWFARHSDGPVEIWTFRNGKLIKKEKQN